MAERVAQFVIDLKGDNTEIVSALQKLKGVFRDTASDLERTTANVELFKGATKSLDEAGAALKRAETNAASLRAQITALREGGQEVGKDLTKSLRDADKQVVASTRSFERQQQAVTQLNTALAKAGVDTKRLADEEARLARETAAAVKAAKEQEARQALGIKSSKDTADALAKINAAYETLRTSGTASLQDLQRAQAGVLKQSAELRAEQGSLGSSFGALKTNVVAVAAALGTVIAGVRAAIDLAREFEVSIARMGTVSTASQAEIKGLANDVRRLSADLGFDLQEGLKATYELLRQGVPTGNIIEVLTTADQAAKAAVVDLGTAAKLTGILIRGFGLDVNGAREAMDQAFALARTGGATFEELAGSLGNLAPLARRLKIPFEEIGVAIATMTRAGLDAPTAIAQLQQILVRLSDPQVAKKLRDMGIETKGLVGTLQSIAEKRLGVDEILELGVSSVKAASGVAALTADSRALAQSLEDVRKASGGLASAADAFEKTDAEKVQRLGASVKSLTVNLGELVLPSGLVSDALTSMTQAADKLVTSFKAVGGQGLGIANVAQAIPVFGSLVGQINALAQSLGLARAASASMRDEVSKTADASRAASAALSASLGEVGKAIAGQIAAADERIRSLRSNLSALVPELQANAKAIQDSAAAAIQSINAQAAARLAGLDKLTNTERQIAAETIAIEKQAQEDRLKVLTDSSKQILEASNAEAKARLAVARSAGGDIQKVERDVATSRASTLRQLVQGYQSYLQELIGLETGHLNKIKELQEQRVAQNANIEERIREIRRAQLPLYEQYADRVSQIDETLSKARRALAAGDLKAAETFANRAIELTSGIATKVEADGQVIVDQFTASNKAVLRLELAQQVLNKTIDERIKSEKEAAEATTSSVKTATEQLGELKKQLDSINETVANGIQVKLEADVTKVNEAIDKLADETKQRELLIGLSIDVEAAKKRIAEVRADLEAGLTVKAQVNLEAVSDAIAKIAEAKPELQVETSAALQALEKVAIQTEKLGEPVTVVATVESNVSAIQAAIDKLKLATFSDHTIRLRTVEVNATGGLVGAKRLAVQGFAVGGPVFNRPAWFKVPGTGDGDTVPAALDAGSYVVRKSASRYYGDDLMRGLAGVRRFAAGGSVSPLLGGRGSSPLSGRPNSGSLLSRLGNGGPLFDLISTAFRVFQPLIDKAKTLPRSTTGQNLADYLVAVLNLIRNSDDLQAASTLLDAVASIAGNLDASINTAHKFHVPIVMGAFAPNEKEGAFASTPVSDLFKALAQAAATGGTFPQGTQGRFARGGVARGTDTVPAMLTPGEFIVSRGRVQELGTGFLHAVNSMRYSREALAGMLRGPSAPQRTRYFEEGGLVGGSSTAPASPPPANTTSNVNVTIEAHAGALLSRENVERYIMPKINDILRRRA